MIRNFICIQNGDLGYGDLGCYVGRKTLTPNIDRMASEGTRCETFYAASAVRLPSRVSYFTGRYPIRFNVTSAFNPFTRKDASFPVVPNLANLLKPEDERPTMCASAGPPPGRWIASSGAARRRRPRSTDRGEPER